MSKDYQTPAQRMRPFLRYLPWRWIAVAALIAVYGLVQYINGWGAPSPLVSFAVGWSCGI